MTNRRLVLLVLMLPFGVVGYLFFAIVVAIYAGLWLADDKMYFAQGAWAQVFGVTGMAVGAVVAWLIWRLGLVLQNGRGPTISPN